MIGWIIIIKAMLYMCSILLCFDNSVRMVFPAVFGLKSYVVVCGNNLSYNIMIKSVLA